MPQEPETARLSIDVPKQVRRRIRLAAARRDLSIRQYVWEAIEARLKEDGASADSRELLPLSESTDPVLADLWDNSADAAYDKL